MGVAVSGIQCVLVVHDPKCAGMDIQSSPLSVSFALLDIDGGPQRDSQSSVSFPHSLGMKKESGGLRETHAHAYIVFSKDVDVFAFPLEPKLYCALPVSSPS